MSSEGLSTQRSFIKYFFKQLPPHLIHLELSFLPRIDVNLLSCIATKFSDLKSLELTSTERLIDDCCWDCYEDASTCTVHSPIPDVYCDAEDLSVSAFSFASYFSKLTINSMLLAQLWSLLRNWNICISASSSQNSTYSTFISTTAALSCSKP